MSKYNMCEAMCALSEGVVVMRRRSLLMPFAIIFIGVALFILNSVIEGGSEMNNLKSAIVLFAAVFILVGGALCVARLGRGGMAPWSKKEARFLRKEELKFNKEDKFRVVDLVEQQDFTTLRQLKQADVSALLVVIWATPAGDFETAQVFEYADLELQPVSRLSIRA